MSCDFDTPNNKQSKEEADEIRFNLVTYIELLMELDRQRTDWLNNPVESKGDNSTEGDDNKIEARQ